MRIENLRKTRIYFEHDAPPWARNIWPKFSSLEYFVKTHRSELVEQGAMRKLGRDYFVDVESFPRVAQQILGVPNGGEGQQ